MKKVLGLFLGLIALMIAGIIGIFALSNAESNPLSDLATQAKASVVDTALDVSGAKAQAKDTLENNVAAIASATGMSVDQVNTVVDNLDIESWKAVALPSSATVAGTLDASTLGIDGSISTYDDPRYVTLNMYGQTVTLEVPESAQEYLSYLM